MGDTKRFDVYAISDLSKKVLDNQPSPVTVSNLKPDTDYHFGSTYAGVDPKVGLTDWGVQHTAEAPVIPAPVIPVNGITADKTLSVGVGKTAKITASVQPDNATDKGLAFVSENALTATVDPDGTVHGVKAGITNVTVSAHADSKQTATVAVTVADAK